MHAVPEPPTAIKGAILNKNSVILSWAPPANTNGMLLGFQIIYYGYKNQDTGKVVEPHFLRAKLLYVIYLQVTRQVPEIVIAHGPLSVSISPNKTSYQIDNLQTGLIYSFKVS